MNNSKFKFEYYQHQINQLKNKIKEINHQNQERGLSKIEELQIIRFENEIKEYQHKIQEMKKNG